MPDFTLYELSTKADAGPAFSPYVWMTRVDAAILGIKPAEYVKLSFSQIRKDLAESTGNDKVKVPTIKVGDEYISDSWFIAEWLDKQYGSEGKSLFPGGAESRGLFKFLEEWAGNVVGPSVGPLIRAKVYEQLDQPCKDYWFVSRFQRDASKIPVLLNNAKDQSYIDSQTATLRDKLRLVENLLQYQQSAGNPLVITGKSYTHADAMIFGWYAFSRMNMDLVKGGWEHEGLPLVKKWLQGIKQLVGEQDLP